MNSVERVMTALRGVCLIGCRCWNSWLTRRWRRPPRRVAATWPIAWTGSTWTPWVGRASFPPIRENSDGTYVDEWDVTYKPGAEAVAHPIRGPIKTLADAKAYSPPDPNAPHRLGKLPELVARYRGKRAICFHHRAAFMWSAYLLGIDNMLMNFLAEPDLVEIVMDKASPATCKSSGGRFAAERRLLSWATTTPATVAQ